ncbi:MRG-domain-containing protein [Patellaria atrata CBS 101060]|uniref:Chromatin modification-related protein EAF3 n=1 Tax=Patellaria atrata CBS 101060 TaxID=1346257 RepID=A0A9P4SD36_9PEZI|nr:MRG-domain-containing protein [Patellaria atrata CBS 101060]
MAPASASVSQPMFAKDEKALCFHHELLYEAKVLDLKVVDPNDKKSPWSYKVHYKGWKNTWDDWVPQDRLRKLTDENKELARDLRKELEQLRNPRQNSKALPVSNHKRRFDASSARGSEERHSSVTAGGGPRGQKRGRDFELEREENFMSRPAVRISIPDRLKSLLVDDWENVTKGMMLVSVPSETPTSLILDEYFEQEKAKRAEGSAEMDILEEVIEGLKDYFDRALGRMLLYRFEREQFAEIYRQMENPTGPLAGKKASDIYGGEHLLRLFTSMPELIAATNMDKQSVIRLREELSRIAFWLSKDENMKRYFSEPYRHVESDYTNKSRGDNKQADEKIFGEEPSSAEA